MEATQTKTFDTRYMVELALMIAIVLLMAFTPIGYIKTPGLSITLITIPVAVGAIVLGPKGGAILGGVFGLTSFSQCFGMGAFGTMLFSINPVGTFITCVIPRILEGLLCGLIFAALKKGKPSGKLSFYVASLSCPVLNTVLFMSSLVLFFYNTDYIQGFADALHVANPFLFVVAFVGVQGLVEAGTCFVVASVVSQALYRALKRA